MKVSNECIELIKKFEGVRLTAYKALPSEKYYTIGYGHYGSDVSANMTITQAQAEDLLKGDLAIFETKVNKYDKTYHFTQNEFDALVSFAYNLGSIDQLTAKGTRSKNEIAEKMLLYNKAGGKVLNGLVKRRQEEHDLFVKGSKTLMLGHSSIDENGNIHGGKAGDQTGKEVCIRSFYNKGWNLVLRCTDRTKAEKMAKACEDACNNPHVGYDQYQRNTLKTQAVLVGFILSRINVDCECDCSSFMTVCAECAGIKVPYNSGNAPTTRTMRGAFTSTGEFEVIPYASISDSLMRGDILVKEGSHTAMVL